MIDLEQSLREFNREFDAATKDLPARESLAIQRRMALDGIGRLVDHTPVDEGDAKGGWQTTVGEPAEQSIDRFDPSGSAVLAEARSVIDSLPPFSVLWFANNEPHILVLEHGLFDPPDPGPSKDKRVGRFGRVLVQGGYSVQAPQGMVALTVEELTTQFG